ncbi:MAG: N-acetylmuramoyl-L-alanine amidase [Oscillospiraceae bacterium]
MAQKKVKRRLHLGRVTGAAIVLFILIMLISSAVKSCSRDKEKNPVPTENSISDSSTAFSQTDEITEKSLVICIDAGHGGNDPGSLAGYTERYEKDDNLTVALATQKYLEKSTEDIRVIMTRDSDEFISLDDRCTIANTQKADLFVSLHRNSAENASGVEVWVHNDEPAPDCRLAYNILVALEKVGISKNKGVRFGYISDPALNYQVNRETDMPSCLVELGFMSSTDDNALFDKNVDAYGKAIAEAIIKTAKELELKGLKSDTKVEPIETDYYNYEVTDYIPNEDMGAH